MIEELNERKRKETTIEFVRENFILDFYCKKCRTHGCAHVSAFIDLLKKDNPESWKENRAIQIDYRTLKYYQMLGKNSVLVTGASTEDEKVFDRPTFSQYLSLKVDVSPGTDIKYAAKEACELAKRLGITVEFEFNNVICIAKPETNYLKLVGKWYLELSSNKPTKIAIAE